MKIDLKILLIVLAVVLIVGLLEADPALRSRRSGGSRRRSSSSTSRRRRSSVSRRRRSSSGSSSGSGTENPVVTIIVVVVVVGIVVLILAYICCIYLRRRQSRQEITDSWGTHEMEKCRNPRGPEGFGNSPTKADEQPDNDIDATQNPAFDNDEDNAALILPYPPGNSDQSAAYPQSSSSLPYPPQGDIDPPGEVTNASLYHPLSTSAYPPRGKGEAMSVVPPEVLEGETQEGSKAFALPLQLDSGNDLPPPPSYEDIEEKKRI